MGFRIHCDACGSFIKMVGIREIRDMNYSSDEPTHCNNCANRFVGLEKQIEKLRGRYTRKLDELAQKANDDLGKLIMKLAGEEKDAV